MPTWPKNNKTNKKIQKQILSFVETQLDLENVMLAKRNPKEKN